MVNWANTHTGRFFRRRYFKLLYILHKAIAIIKVRAFVLRKRKLISYFMGAIGARGKVM